MRRKETIRMLKAKLECMIRDVSGSDDDCNRKLCGECPLNYKQGNMGEQKEYLQMSIDALEQTRWIPVSERLPEQPYGCLVTIEDEEPMTGQMFETILPYHVGWDGERWNDSDGEQCPFEVIAWMPLPNVYRNEE